MKNLLIVLSVGLLCSPAYAEECETPFVGTIYPSTLYSMGDYTTVGEFPTLKDCEDSMLNLLRVMQIPLEKAPMYQCSWGCRPFNDAAEDMPYYDRLRTCKGVFDYRAPFGDTSISAIRGEDATCENIKDFEDAQAKEEQDKKKTEALLLKFFEQGKSFNNTDDKAHFLLELERRGLDGGAVGELRFVCVEGRATKEDQELCLSILRD